MATLGVTGSREAAFRDVARGASHVHNWWIMLPVYGDELVESYNKYVRKRLAIGPRAQLGIPIRRKQKEATVQGHIA